MGRLHQRSCLILGAFWLVLPGTVWASPPDMEVLLTGQVETDASGEQVVALRFLNRTDRQEILALPDRSEEHTSELQSLMRISYAVFCLKKKINQELHRNN